jgi:D-arabinose 1-dehydrogenase-like Zn-dependent alcohol dehydrogenase
MLCGGVTVYSPLMHWKAGPGKRVAILGLGGLGHFGVLFAKALGCDEVVGISRKAEKKDQALQLGCDDYIATDDDKEWSTKWAKHFDLIISTASGSDVSNTIHPPQLLQSLPICCKLIVDHGLTLRLT